MPLRNRRPPKCRVSYKTPERSPKSSADKVYRERARMLKDQTLKKTRALLFPDRNLGLYYGLVCSPPPLCGPSPALLLRVCCLSCDVQALRPRPPLTRVSRALRARNPKKSPRESPGAFRPRGRKSVRNSLKTISGVSKETVLRLRRLF